jgi:hypothetical protein
VQRFGGALNLDVHFHCLVPDGVFVEEKQGIRFVGLPGASEDEVRDVLERIVRRVRKLLRPRADATHCDTRDPDALAAAVVSLRGRPPNAGRKQERRLLKKRDFRCMPPCTSTRTIAKALLISAGTAPVRRSCRRDCRSSLTDASRIS